MHRYILGFLFFLLPLSAFADGVVQLPPVFRNEASEVRILALPYHLADTDMARHWEWTGGGEGVIVGVADTGLDADHPEIKGKVIAGKSFVNRRNPDNWNDRNGHGTHVATTIAGRNVGVAPNCRLVIAQVLGSNGSGSNRGVALGLRWLADQGCNIINVSLGGPTDDAETREAVFYAKSKGCLVVVATGNERANEVGFPAQHGVGVGAVNRAMTLAWFSNRGKFCDLVGYGVDVYAGVPGGKYAEFSGTSMATPFIVGIAANRLSAEIRYLGHIVTNSDERLLDLETYIVDLGPEGRDVAYGRGFPDLDRCFYEGLVEGGTSETEDPKCELPDRINVRIGDKEAIYQLAP